MCFFSYLYSTKLFYLVKNPTNWAGSKCVYSNKWNKLWEKACDAYRPNKAMQCLGNCFTPNNASEFLNKDKKISGTRSN